GSGVSMEDSFPRSRHRETRNGKFARARPAAWTRASSAERTTNVCRGILPLPHRSHPTQVSVRSLCPPALHGDAGRAVDDLAHQPCVVSRAPDRVEGPVRLVTRQDGEHAEAEVEDLLHLLVAHVAGLLDLREDPRLLPAPTAHDRAAVCGKDAHEI